MEYVLLACILLLKLMKKHFTEWLTTGSLAIPFPRAISFVALLKKTSIPLFIFIESKTYSEVHIDGFWWWHDILEIIIKITLTSYVEQASKQCHSLHLYFLAMLVIEILPPVQTPY